MNPFDLRGPEFLLFYVLLCGAALVALIVLRRRAESGEGPRANLSDPYLIAYLRGGKNEALRVATVSLVDRGLLHAYGSFLRTVADPWATERVKRPIEKALLEHFREGKEASSIFEDASLHDATEALGQALMRQGFLPDEQTRGARFSRAILAVALLWGVALVKLYVAFGRGRYNVGFLVLVAIAFPFAAALATRSHRTARGDALLDDLRELFAHLKERIFSLHPGGATEEAALLAAVYGVGALPSQWNYAKELYPKASSSSSRSSCGSACGPSCGSSCGSSCGGGCGGGCGGCGG